MKAAGVVPARRCYHALMAAWAGWREPRMRVGERLDRAMEVYDEMVRHGHPATEETFAVLYRACMPLKYGREGWGGYSEPLKRMMQEEEEQHRVEGEVDEGVGMKPERGRAGGSRAGGGDGAKQDPGLPITVDPRVYRIEQLQIDSAVLHSAESLGALLRTLAESHDLEGAAQRLADACQGGRRALPASVYADLIQGCARRVEGSGWVLNDLVHDMERYGVQPTYGVYLGLMMACLTLGDVSRGVELWGRFLADPAQRTYHGLQFYATAIKLFDDLAGRQDLVEEVRRVMSERTAHLDTAQAVSEPERNTKRIEHNG
ncbi:hypothetical protein M427DRAFT_52569 [Gonapodya prolifera JEL478]|uniref:Pentacotripeptide-repeat region of PRORP domain-containing protein n=1 Tax=Gonapodya prolifera (strain JEL478) TaxID=1344416 RepID=A0A139AT39_GONPJ|nr:hypothetical protein M427DRAFT_52569 [Gonapodya prolifera JEL478]|eukprot:KXS19665.1 hypothetical protein M427DRAFT_52569 [Gonapodya prolifera JEL478]